MPDTRATAVSAAITKVRHLATLPEIATKIIKVADDPDAGVQAMSDVITRAPELCTRILKVVNSAFYGVPGHVSSVQRAIALIGLRSVKNVAIAASLTKTFQGPRVSNFSPRDLWAHGLSVAAATRMIAAAAKSPLVEEAFLAGLLHDVGLMVELQYDRQAFISVLNRLDADAEADVLLAEEEAFHATHQDFGAAVAERWKLPRSLALVAGWHHRPLDLPDADRTLVTMVYAADRLVASCAPPFRFDRGLAEVGDEVFDELRLTRDQLARVLVDLPPVIAEAQTFLAAA
jgi:HD-like signal output (HDOD) protein